MYVPKLSRYDCYRPTVLISAPTISLADQQVTTNMICKLEEFMVSGSDDTAYTCTERMSESRSRKLDGLAAGSVVVS
jgi:hypothetical protein